MSIDKDALKELQSWIDKGGEIGKVARRIKARLGDGDSDDAFVLQIEMENMRRYFKLGE